MAQSHGGEIYDADGIHLGAARPDELAELLRRWLGHADALRESTANWSLGLLVRAAVEHGGYAD